MARPYIFLSHSSRDKPLVRRIDRRLRDCGVDTFLDEGELAPGDSLPDRFRRAIGSSSHVAVVWTPSAAASPWVARELKFASSRLWRKPQIVPLLFTPPGNDPLIHNIKGVDFSNTFEFEAAFSDFFRYIAGTASDAPPSEAAFRATLDETPTIRSVFAATRPQDLATLSLPAPGEADWQALDHAMWSAARRAGQVEAFVTYPAVFARAFGATGGGFEALRLLASLNDVTDKTFPELIDLPATPDPVLDQVITLAERNAQPPHGWAWRFAVAQRARLSSAQRRRLFRLVETWGDVPSPGGPVDLLGELIISEDMREEVIGRMTSWLERGLFDGSGTREGADSPYLWFGFIAALHKRGLAAEAGRINAAACARIRKLFRIATPASVSTAFRWVSGADRLPLNPAPYAHAVQNAVQEGVYSSEFETWEHARAVAPLAGHLAAQLLHPHDGYRRQEMDEARRHVAAALQPLGLQPVLL